MNINLDQELRNVHKSIAKIVKVLDGVVDEISKKEAKTSKYEEKRKPNQTPGIKGTVLSTIEKSKKGVTIQEIKARTKLQERQVNNALYKLSKNGFVKAKTRGVYIVEDSKYRA